MSVESANEAKREGYADASGRYYMRDFIVQVSSPSADGPTTILDYFETESSLPYVYDEYPEDENCICTKVTPTRSQESRLVWYVKVLYRPRNNAIVGGGEVLEFPWNEKPAISFDWSSINKVVDRAYKLDDDNPETKQDPRDAPSIPIQNSAGQSFDPPVLQEVSNQVIKINRKENNFRPSTAEEYKNTINLEQIVIADITVPVSCGLMRGISGRPAWTETGQKYWEVEYVIEVRNDTHVRQLLDIGFYEKNETGNWVPVKDTENNYVTEPKKLDGQGKLLDASAKPVYLKYQTYFSRKWSSLDLPRGVE